MTMHLVDLPRPAFALEPIATVSERYSLIDSAYLDQQFIQAGFIRHKASAKNVRKPEKQGKQAHIVSYRHASAPTANELGGLIQAVSFLNSHDGTTQGVITGLIERMVCLNGLHLPDFIVKPVKIKHLGPHNAIAQQIIEGSFRVISETGRAIETAREWQKIELSRIQQLEFAHRALQLKYPKDGKTESPIKEVDILTPRRWDDASPNLWQVFNRAQEHIIKGGLIGRNAQGRQRTVRAVKDITKDVKLNQALWELANEYAIAA
jgi:Domain of unknown function (DUF932)